MRACYFGIYESFVVLFVGNWKMIEQCSLITTLLWFWIFYVSWNGSLFCQLNIEVGVRTALSFIFGLYIWFMYV